LLLDSGGLRGLGGERLDVAVALQIARGLQQLQMETLEALALPGETAATKPGEHARHFAAGWHLDAVSAWAGPAGRTPPARTAQAAGCIRRDRAGETPRMNVDRGPGWAKPVLLAAAAYNLVFGALVVLFPRVWFEWADLPAPNHPSLWQCIGMIVGVYGIGYAIAAFAPLRHWPIVLVGLCGKVLGPIGFLDAAWRGELPWHCGWLILGNDVIWWVPFGALLLAARAHHRQQR